MLRTIEMYTNEYKETTKKEIRKKKGQFLIVTRLFQSKEMTKRFPDDAERLNHIFAKQVYGCAPTEIIYRI